MLGLVRDEYLQVYKDASRFVSLMGVQDHKQVLSATVELV